MRQELREKLEKIYLSIIQWGTYVALFSPLIFVKEYFFPFVVPKTVFFRIVVDIIFIAYILLIISNRKYLPKFTPLTITIIVFLGVVILTSFTGVNLEKSFWSVFERMTGILSFLHLFVFYIILSSVFRKRSDWEKILSVSMLVGILICFYVWTSKETATRGGGTVGNTSFLAAYLLFDIIFAIIMFFTKNGWWKAVYGAALSVLLAGLFVSIERCRGAIGAFFIGMFFLGLGYLMFYLFSSGRKKLKKLALLIMLLLVLEGVVLLQLKFVKTKVLGLWNSGSIQSRLIVWKMGFDSWRERFWLGWGQENFNIPFAKYFNPSLPLTFDVWYDRVHNIVFDTAVTSGVLGLASYFAIFGVAIFYLIKILPKITEKKNAFFPLGMITVLMVYFIQNMFVFDMISTYIMFFLSLAFINFLATPFEEESESDAQIAPSPDTVKVFSLTSFLGAALIIAAVWAIYFGNIQVARASRYTVFGLSFPLEQSIYDFEKALASSPISKFEVPEQFSSRMVALASDANQDQEILKQGFVSALDQLEKSVTNSPSDFRARLFLGRYYDSLYQFTNDKEKVALAEETLKKAIILSPKNQQGYWSLGQTMMFEGKKEEAIQLFKQAVDLEPKFIQSHRYLSLVYRIYGDYESALAEVKEAEKLGYNWKANIEDVKHLIEIYKGLNDKENLVTFYEIATIKDPSNVDFWGNLADLYAQTGQKEKAKTAAEKVLELKPELKEQIDAFLKELGY